LKDGAQIPGALQKSIIDISNRMFTNAIRALEKDTLVKRTVFPDSPRVEYELTDAGKSLMPIILTLNQWGKDVASYNHLYGPRE
jgi:DNA-binding HxlR family transcriptional regulator